MKKKTDLSDLHPAVRRSYETKFMQLMSVELEECRDGRCSFEMEVQEHHLQQKGYVHGGVLAAMIDHCGGTAAATLVGDEEHVLTSDINVSYLRPAMSPRIRFEGEVLKKGSTLIVCEVRVFNLDSKHTLCTVGRVTLGIRRAD